MSKAIWRPFAVAAAVSGVVHAAVAVFGHIELPEAPPDGMPLAMRLVAAPAAPRPAATAPVRRAASLPSGVRVASAERVFFPIRAATAEPAEVAEEIQPPVEADAPLPEPAAVAEAEPPKPEPVVVAEEPPARTLPRKGRITYDVVYGRDRFPVGRTVLTWEADGRRYQLASRSETTGLADVIRSQHRSYVSRGALTREGLKPEAFEMHRNRGGGRANEEASAQFDWTKSTVTLVRAADSRQEKLPPKSQDLLSFMYQFALDPPPPGRLTQVVTNGSRIEVYELDVLREEKIETPLGVLRALPIRQVRKGNEESIELWLAMEYRYLPVRVRFLDKKGDPSGEQIVADIRLIEN